jgi:hypothetical protein
VITRWYRTTARTSRSLVRFVLVAAMALVVSTPEPAHAQGITRHWLDWHTIRTDHFAIHYPADLEEWAKELASNIESVRGAVKAVVGYAPPDRVDIVVDDPYAQSNGSAWPFIGSSAIEMWATPPTPRDDIGNFRSWSEILAVHEFAHIAHLTRPTRNSLQGLLYGLLPANFGPVARKAPRWVTEGYATFVEGRLTGSGRPHGVWRPAVLRQWALEGQLPQYEQLSTGVGYIGGSFAYLGGSAFIDWLAAKHGDSSLVQVWRRMTAKIDRPFDVAFTGVYGQSPAALYGQFTAELTAHAMTVRREMTSAGSDTGEIIQRLSRYTGDPAISSDGSRIALVVRADPANPRTVIWRTAPEPDTLAARSAEELRKYDPDDVPGRTIYPPRKKVIAELHSVNGSAYNEPRFMRDGRVLVGRYTAQGDGTVRPDLYMWDPQSGTVKRVTHGASVTDADPSPDGKSAVATQCARGRCALVRVDLETGGLTPMGTASVTRTFYRPRFAPDGQSVVVSVHDSTWRLAIVALDGTVRREIRTLDRAVRYDASFLDANTIVAVSEGSGAPAIERVDINTGARTTIAVAAGATLAPAPNPADGSVWFLSLHSRGLDLRRVLGTPTQSVAIAPFPARGPVITMPPVASTLTVARPYGFGPRQWRWVPAGEAGADGSSGLLAVANTDIIGRAELLVQGMHGTGNTWTAGSAAFTLRAMKPVATVMAFAGRQHMRTTPEPTVLDTGVTRMRGGLATIEFKRATESRAMRLAVGGVASQVEYAPSPNVSRSFAFADGGLGWSDATGRATGSVALRGSMTVGSSDGEKLSRAIVGTTARVGAAGLGAIGITAMYGRNQADYGMFERFSVGGSPVAVFHPVLLQQRIAMPALAAGTLGGDQVATGRVSFGFGSGLEAYVWGGTAWNLNDTPGGWEQIRGVEWSGALPAVGTAGTPAARISAGAGARRDPVDGRKHLITGYFVMGFGDFWRP